MNGPGGWFTDPEGLVTSVARFRAEHDVVVSRVGTPNDLSWDTDVEVADARHGLLIAEGAWLRWRREGRRVIVTWEENSQDTVSDEEPTVMSTRWFGTHPGDVRWGPRVDADGEPVGVQVSVEEGQQ